MLQILQILALIASLLTTLIGPSLFIFLGALFVLADIFLGVSREPLKEGGKEKFKGTKRTFSIAETSHLRLALRTIAFFLFTAATIFIGGELEIISEHQPIHRVIVLLGYSFIQTLIIILGGILLPRAIARSSHRFLISCNKRLTAILSILVHPLVTLIDQLSPAGKRFFQLFFDEKQLSSSDEVIELIEESSDNGIFEAEETRMILGVLDLESETVATLMTPHSDFVWLDLNATPEDNWYEIAHSGYSEFPVFQGNHDHVLGIVSIKALWANLSLTGTAELANLIIPPLYVPSTMNASKLIEEFRRSKRYTALVVDEFGVIVGMITLKDVMESILGELPRQEMRQQPPKITQQAPDTWLVDAMLTVEEAHQSLGINISEKLEEEGPHYFQTIGGFVLAQLGHVPAEGESLTWNSFHFQIVSMEKRRIVKLLIQKLSAS